MQVLFEIMVQNKQKGGTGVESPPPRSFSGGAIRVAPKDHFGENSILNEVVGGSQGSGRQEGLGRESWKGDLRAEIVSGTRAEFFDDLRHQNAI